MSKSRKRADLEKVITQYDVPFENVFDSKSIRETYLEYLKESHNEEPLLFMTDLDHYVTLLGTGSRYKAAKNILVNYLELGAPHSINVSNKLREEARQIINESNETKCPKDLFDNIRVAVYLDLKQTLPAFLSSEHFRDHVFEQLKTDPDYLNNLGTLRLNFEDTVEEAPSTPNTLNIPTTSSASSTPTTPTTPSNKLSDTGDAFVSDPTINDYDFQASLDDMANLDMWKLVYQSEARVSRVNADPIMHNGREIRKIFDTIMIPYTPTELFYAMVDMDYFHITEKMASGQTSFDYVTYDKYAATFLYTTFNFGIIVQKRDMVTVGSTRRESDGSIVICQKSIESDKAPVKKGHIRMKMRSVFRLVPAPNNSCVLQGVVMVDMGGWITPGIFNKIAERRADIMASALKKACAERKELDLRKPHRSSRMVDTLEHFELATGLQQSVLYDI